MYSKYKQFVIPVLVTITIISITIFVWLSIRLYVTHTKNKYFVTNTIKSWNWDTARNLILSDCNTIPLFDYVTDNDTYINYHFNLFNTFNEDITYNLDTNFFSTPSNKTLSIYSVELDRSGTEDSQNLYCWVALIKDSSTSGRAAYLTKIGKTKILQIINSPNF